MQANIPATGSLETHEGCQVLRQARNLPDLFERAASIFRDASGAAYSLLYLAVSDDEAVELSYAGSPPARSREIAWHGSLDPQAPAWRQLDASEIMLVEHRQRPYALVVLGPREAPRSDSATTTLPMLCGATAEMLAQALLETRALAAEFQEQRANRHHQQAKWLHQRLKQVSHDMRNHLTPMLYATEELQELLSAPDALKLIISLERQIKLADQLSKQSLNHLASGPSAQQTDLTAVTREITDGWHGLLARHSQTLLLRLPPHPVWVAGTPTQYHQVLGNLLSNANKFTPRGGSIRVSLTLEDGVGLLEVSDTGRGIGPLVRKRLFEAQVREHTGIEGHGLGLTNVQAILKELGGAITVSSQPGRGSTFQVRLTTRPAPIGP